MLNEKVKDALNEQVNAELYSAYLYLSMVAYFKKISLEGFARWMEIQAMEEMTHAMKIFEYISERGSHVILTPIAGPETMWESPLAVFEDAYRHEVKVSDLINNLVDIAMEHKDHATTNFLQWFVGEQVEEETTADTVVQKLKLVGNDGGGLFMLDQELGARVFVPPPGTTIFGGGGKA